MRQNMPHRRDPPGPEDEKGVYRISGRLPDMSPVQDVLSCRCNHHFTGEVYSGGSFVGIRDQHLFQKQFSYSRRSYFLHHTPVYSGTGQFPEANRIEGITFCYDNSGILRNDRAVFCGTNKQLCVQKPHDEQADEGP